MKLVSWNVNGLRACMNKGFADFFMTTAADVVCVQETKMLPDQADISFPGYRQFWNSALKKGYSGTAVFSRLEPLSVSYGMGRTEHDQEGRLITLEFEGFQLINVYTPNSQRGLSRLEYRLQWEDDFRAFVGGLDARKPVIICGDLNVAHREIDIRNPAANKNNAGFTPQERQKMTELLESGLIDSFRHLNPEARDVYSWWSYMGNARERNVGWRIDYFLVSGRLGREIRAAEVWMQVPGSDHCPVVLDIF